MKLTPEDEESKCQECCDVVPGADKLEHLMPLGTKGDEDAEVNDEIEFAAAKAEVVSIPSKLKAVLKFGYDEGWKTAFDAYDFNEWIVGVFAHTQAHYKDPSLGTQVTFEVRFCCLNA